jgi:cation diffusion facilitator family transporter
MSRPGRYRGHDLNGHGHAGGHGCPREQQHPQGHIQHGHEHSHQHGNDHPGWHERRRGHGVNGLLRAVFAPHSHDAAESVDQALTGSDSGMRCLVVSLGLLAATAAIQLVIVLFSGSIALLGDTIHNFADALTAVPLAVAFWVQRRPPTRRYTYGYGRAEDLAGAFIVAMIAGSMVLAAWAAVDRLLHPGGVRAVGWVIAAGLVGFAGNELAALYRVRVGRRIGSAALVADGRHARADGVTSLAVVAGAVGVAAGWPEADPVAGLLITVAVLAILRNAARDIYRRLMDSVDPALVGQVERVLSGVDGVQQVKTVRIRWVGHVLQAEATLVSDRDLTLSAAHAISEEAHHRLLHEVPRLGEALIHSDPSGHGGDEPHALTAHHFAGRPGRPGRLAG